MKKTRTIQILAALTFVAAGAAVLARQSREKSTRAEAQAGAPLFEGLRGKVNDVTSVAVAGATESFTLERKEGTWGAAEKGGYPVDLDKVKALVVGLSELKVLEEKTKNPAYFAKLGVEDPSEKDAKSKRVTLKDKGGNVLADLIVGETAQSRSFTGQPSIFVRRIGGERALEVAGRLQVDTAVANWLDKQIAKLEKKRVRRVETVHADGERLVVRRASESQENFDVEGLPEGSELSWPGVAGSIGGALEYMSFEDVKPSAEVDFAAQPVTTARFESFDGLVVTCTTFEKDEDTFLRIEAAFDESVRTPDPPETPETIGPPAPPEGEAEEGEAPPPIEPAKPELKSVDEVKAEVDKLNARLKDWAFVLPGWSGANLRKRTKDLLKQPEPPAGATDLPGTEVIPLEPAPPAPVDPGIPPADPAPAPPEDGPAPPPEPTPPEPEPEEKPAPPGGGS